MYAITEDAYVVDYGETETEIEDNIQGKTEIQDINEEKYLK